jgi:hypothetical protein
MSAEVFILYPKKSRLLRIEFIGIFITHMHISDGMIALIIEFAYLQCYE